ncbi:glycoprotease family-domain-containing protein, partial [Pavlovales sp. CCMP2436]
MFLHGGMGLTCASPLAIARTIRLAPISRIARVALRMSAAPERMPRTAPRLERGMPKAIETDASGVSGLRIRAEALSGLPDRSQPFIVLGIETSCDDTAAAVVRSDGVILGEAIAKQDAIHAEWGGVVPGLARDAHIEAVGRVVSEAIAAAGLSSVADVDAIGVTVGPGLEICLRIGANHAVSLAEEHRKPFVAVHHLEAHCLMARLAALADSPGETDPLPFPFLSLLVSGGHCQLLLCRGVGDYSVIGSTLDDALGEAYDKVARLLGLDVGGGGGPALEAFAKKGDASKAKLPVPMSKRKDTAFSFAGLKTAVRTRLAKLENGGTEEERADLAAAFQEAAIMHIERRLRYALVWCAEQQLLPTPLEGEAAKVPPITSLVVSGGVAANQALRGRLRSLCEANNVRMYTPPTRLCTDNGVMVAWVAIERLLLGHSDTATGTEVRARWPLGRALDIKLT